MPKANNCATQTIREHTNQSSKHTATTHNGIEIRTSASKFAFLLLAGASLSAIICASDCITLGSMHDPSIPQTRVHKRTNILFEQKQTNLHNWCRLRLLDRSLGSERRIECRTSPATALGLLHVL